MSFVTASGYVFFAHTSTSLPPLRERVRDAQTALAASGSGDLRGTILLSTEGANVLLCGTPEAVAAMKAALPGCHPSFSECHYKDTLSVKPTLARFLVKIKKEIISMGYHADSMTPARSSPGASHLAPHDFKRMIESKEEMVVLDTRNDYEVRLGTFEGALDLDIKSFRAFPEAAKASAALDPAVLGDRPVVMFCTGGVRCEKAAYVLKERGVRNVMQLKGGILHYLEACGPDHYDGECYVFDDRVALDAKLEETDTKMCFVCRAPLTVADQESEDYVPEKSCPYCKHGKTDFRSASAAGSAASTDDTKGEAKVQLPPAADKEQEETAALELARSGRFTELRGMSAKGALRSAIRSARDKHGSNVLHFAAGHGHLDAVMWLAAGKGNGGTDDDEDHREVVPVSAVNGKGRAPLHWAARNGHTAVVGALIELGSHVDVKAHGDVTPLQLAVWQAHEATASCLVDKGADPRVVNAFGCSTAHWAALSPCGGGGGGGGGGGVQDGDAACHQAAPAHPRGPQLLRLCKWLKGSFSVDFAGANHQGHTPLHKAAYARNRVVCEFLVDELRVVDDAVDKSGDFASDKALRVRTGGADSADSRSEMGADIDEDGGNEEEAEV
eukprot:g3387.t1